jgi:hypothetical protein
MAIEIGLMHKLVKSKEVACCLFVYFRKEGGAMKNVVKVCLLTFVFGVFLLLLSGITQAAEKGKISGHGESIRVIAEYRVYPDDVEHHSMALAIRKDKWMSDVKIAGLSFNDATIILRIFEDYIAFNGPHRGQITGTFKSDDKFFENFEGSTKATFAKGQPSKITFEGKWSFTGGTGKLKGIKGGGTYTGEVTSEGVARYDWTGNYELP